ncbi:hypothetical protein QQG55_47730 [Brugia pahangi]
MNDQLGAIMELIFLCTRKIAEKLNVTTLQSVTWYFNAEAGQKLDELCSEVSSHSQYLSQSDFPPIIVFS